MNVIKSAVSCSFGHIYSGKSNVKLHFLCSDPPSDICQILHYVKIVRIRSYSGPYFRAFGLNMERYGVRGCSYGSELAWLGRLARLGEISPSLRNYYKHIMRS